MADNDETQEIEQLRRRVSELEGELETARSPGTPGVGALPRATPTDVGVPWSRRR